MRRNGYVRSVLQHVWHTSHVAEVLLNISKSTKGKTRTNLSKQLPVTIIALCTQLIMLNFRAKRKKKITSNDGDDEWLCPLCLDGQGLNFKSNESLVEHLKVHEGDADDQPE